MTVDEMRAKYRALRREARELINSIKDDTPEAEARKTAAKVDGIMLEMDELNDRIEEQIERERTEEIDTSRRPGGGSFAVRGDGRRVCGEDDAATAFAIGREQRFADYIGERGQHDPYSELTVGQYVRALVLGAKTDIERRALSEGSDSAGGFTVPTMVSARMIDALRAASVAVRAGALTVPLTGPGGTFNVAKVATDPTPSWRSEHGSVAESEPTFTRVQFVPRSLTVLVKASREVLQDSMNLERVLPQIIASSMALEVDRAALFGTGMAPQPKGVVYHDDIESIAHNSTLTTYVPLVRARTRVLENNAPGITAYILHPRDAGALAELTASDGQPLTAPKVVADTPFLETTSVPEPGSSPNDSMILTGWFPFLLIGMRSELRIEILRERYADNFEYGFLAHLRMDTAVEHEGAFCVISGILPSS